MKTLNETQVKLIHSALIHYATEQENIISEHYLDLDQEQIVAESEKILTELNEIFHFFVNKKKLHLMSEWDKETIEAAFNRSDQIYESEDNYVLKSGMFLGLIDGIKAVVKNKH